MVIIFFYCNWVFCFSILISKYFLTLFIITIFTYLYFFRIRSHKLISIIITTSMIISFVLCDIINFFINIVYNFWHMNIDNCILNIFICYFNFDTCINPITIQISYSYLQLILANITFIAKSWQRKSTIVLVNLQEV